MIGAFRVKQNAIIYTADDAARETCNCNFKGLHACMLSYSDFFLVIFFFFFFLLLFFCFFFVFIFFFKKIIKNTVGVSNGLNPDQAPRFHAQLS